MILILPLFIKLKVEWKENKNKLLVHLGLLKNIKLLPKFAMVSNHLFRCSCKVNQENFSWVKDHRFMYFWR